MQAILRRWVVCGCRMLPCRQLVRNWALYSFLLEDIQGPRLALFRFEHVWIMSSSWCGESMEAAFWSNEFPAMWQVFAPLPAESTMVCGHRRWHLGERSSLAASAGLAWWFTGNLFGWTLWMVSHAGVSLRVDVCFVFSLRVRSLAENQQAFCVSKGSTYLIMNHKQSYLRFLWTFLPTLLSKYVSVNSGSSGALGVYTSSGAQNRTVTGPTTSPQGPAWPFPTPPCNAWCLAAHATVGRQMPLMICHWAPGFAIWASKRASVDVRDIAGTGTWVWVGFLAWSILLTEETMEPTWKKNAVIL